MGNRIIDAFNSLVFRILGAVLLSVLIPLGLSFMKDGKGESILSDFENIVLGALIFLITTAVSTAYEVNEVLKLRQQRQEDWVVASSLDADLQNIRAGFSEQVASRPFDMNLIAQHFLRRVTELSDEILGSVKHREVLVDIRTFEVTRLLLNIIEKRGCDVIKLVAVVPDHDSRSETAAWTKSYFRELSRIANAKNGVSVQRLFIYQDQDDLARDQAQLMLRFHHTNSGYSARTLCKDDWDSVAKGNTINVSRSIFGIWGDFVVYVALEENPTHMEGVFIENPVKIAQFMSAFDTGWKLARPTQFPDSPVVLDDELFE